MKFLGNLQKPIVSARKTRTFFKCLFAVFHTPAMVSCKECVFDRGRNYCIFADFTFVSAECSL